LASRSYTVWKSKGGGVNYVRSLYGETVISNADTITFSEMSSTSNLLEAYFIKKSDGSEMTCTHAANNVATISGAGTNVDCIFLVYGYDA
jgi:hypothetical protein